MDGGGFVLICAVGKFSQLGKLKLALQEDEEPTPLQVKLEGLAEDIGIIGLVSALLTIGALLIHLIVKIVMGEVY